MTKKRKRTDVGLGQIMAVAGLNVRLVSVGKHAMVVELTGRKQWKKDVLGQICQNPDNTMMITKIDGKRATLQLVEVQNDTH